MGDEQKEICAGRRAKHCGPCIGHGYESSISRFPGCAALCLSLVLGLLVACGDAGNETTGGGEGAQEGAAESEPDTPPLVAKEASDPVDAPSDNSATGASEAPVDGGERGPDSQTTTERHSETGAVIPVLIDSRREDVNIPLENPAEAATKTEDYLRDQGVLGDSDALQAKEPQRILGDSKILKLQQTYKGIPVWGAESTVTITSAGISNIESKTVPDLDLSVEPATSYQQALQKASSQSEQTLEAEDEGRLIIYNQQREYTLAWYGLIRSGEGLEYVVLSAANAAILLRYPAMQSE